MAVCSICGVEENVFKYRIHVLSRFDNDGLDVDDYAGEGVPIPSFLVDTLWKEDTLCTHCAHHTWGCTTVEDERYPEGYVYNPHPVIFYWCAGCERYHTFPNADRWYQGTIPSIPAQSFTHVFTSGRGNMDYNLPPYTSHACTPISTQAVACRVAVGTNTFQQNTGIETRICSYCGRIFTTDHLHWDGSNHICDDCIDCTTYCADCGNRIHISEVFRDENDDQLCESCYDERSSASRNINRYIQDYSYKPCPDFFTNPEEDHNYSPTSHNSLPIPYFGIELEIDQKGSHDTEDPEVLARYYSTEVNGFTNRFYIKYDGSLNNGMEIVSHPHTYAAHYNLGLWKDIMAAARSNGYTSHDARSCGLHFHISRNSLGKTRQEQDDTAYKMVLMTEVMWDDFVKFSRRTSFGYCHKHGVWIKSDSFNKFKDKTRSNMSRHNAVNLSNTNTVEFRLIRGTINYNTFIASLQFVYMVRLLAMTLSSVSITNSTFSIFIETALRLGFHEFLEYCKERKFSHKILIPVEAQSDTVDQSPEEALNSESDDDDDYEYCDYTDDDR